MLKAILASQNPHKAEEFAAALPGIAIIPTPVAIDVEENADTFMGNARLKALAYARSLKCNALADDSGLCVDALQGYPGVFSARYATLPPDVDKDPNRTAANNRKLLRNLENLPEDQRGAHFCCALCLIIMDKEDIRFFCKKAPDSENISYYNDQDSQIDRHTSPIEAIEYIEIHVLGQSFGRILTELHGSGGFGYDPLFYSTEAHCTFAELTREQKLTVSHRGKAINLLKQELSGLAR